MSEQTITGWRNKNVWAISLSAFFADLGYQTILAGFPILLVIILKQPYWEYGLATAISYGGGAIFSYYGAKIGSKIGHRRLALIGNSAIPLLSLCALVANPAWAIGLLVGGWWSRNLRSPSRRVMLVEAVPVEKSRAKAFGFMHGLDVGGGAMAGLFLAIALEFHLPIKWTFLITIAPLLASTYSLSRSDVGSNPKEIAMRSAEQKTDTPAEHEPEETSDHLDKGHYLKSASNKLILAALLYGFTFYSTGFLVLTTAKSTNSTVGGVIAYLLVQLISALTGYLIAPRIAKNLVWQFASLGSCGYIAGSLGAVIVAVSAVEHLGFVGLDIGVAVIGFALGIVDTLEPASMSLVTDKKHIAKGFGSLAAARSMGTFSANLIMGLLYEAGVAYAYGYAAVLALAAGIAVLLAIPAVAKYTKSVTVS